MNTNIKIGMRIYLINTVISFCIFGYTMPIIQLYMMKNVTDDIFKISQLLGVVISFFVAKWMASGPNRLKFLRRYFNLFVIIDCVSLAVFNALSMIIDVNVRFIGITIFGIFGVDMICGLLNDLLNHIYSKDDLTIIQKKIEMCQQGGRILGLVLSVVCSMDIEIALFVQTIVVFITSIVDIMFFNQNKHHYD